MLSIGVFCRTITPALQTRNQKGGLHLPFSCGFPKSPLHIKQHTPLGIQLLLSKQNTNKNICPPKKEVNREEFTDAHKEQQNQSATPTDQRDLWIIFNATNNPFANPILMGQYTYVYIYTYIYRYTYIYIDIMIWYIQVGYSHTMKKNNSHTGYVSTYKWNCPTWRRAVGL